MVDACTWAAGEAGVRRRRRARRDVLPRLPGQAGLEPLGDRSPRRSSAAGSSRLEVATGGGSDANALRAHGFDALLLANGTEANHTRDESVAAVRARSRCSTSARRSSRRPALVLKLRRGTVVSADPLEVEVAGERRRAWADDGPGRARARSATRSIVNTAAIDLGLGSGGFDVVHVNLTRGLEGGETPARRPRDEAELHLAPAPGRADRGAGRSRLPAPVRRMPVLVLPLHGHLAPAAWAAARHARGVRIGFVQAGGRRLPGSLSATSRELRSRGLLAAQVTVAPSYGGELEAISLDRRAPRRGGRARLGRGDRRARAPGSSAPRPGTGTAAWPRSTPPTPRSPSACPP